MNNFIFSRERCSNLSPRFFIHLSYEARLHDEGRHESARFTNQTGGVLTSVTPILRARRQVRDATPSFSRTPNLTLDRIPLPPESVITDPSPSSIVLFLFSLPCRSISLLQPVRPQYTSISSKRFESGGKREFGLETESGRESVAPLERVHCTSEPGMWLSRVEVRVPTPN